MIKYFLPVFTFIFLSLISVPQAMSQVSTVDSLETEYLNWYNQDLAIDKIHGTSTERVYSELLKNRQPKKTIVVAIIDSGVDILHEDLQGKIWQNEGEIADNNLDDDNNGYIDDIHGWNFIGNDKGENIHLENFEYTRMYKKYNAKFENVSSTDGLTQEEEDAFLTYRQSKALYEENLSKYKKEEEGISMFQEIFDTAKEIIKVETGINPVSLKDLKSIRTKSKRTSKAISFLIDKYKMGLTEDKLNEYKSHNYECLNMHLNVDFNPRDIIGDNPADIADIDYGNNDVKGPRSDHGTSVAGVVAAGRKNGIGIDGIVENVKLMVLRTIPKGDEYDKDVALAIRYAADNGANIINMSFGKELSPNKEFVDEAIKYAEGKNVLMVHASGNNGIDVDIEPRFPSDYCDDGHQVKPWINVGASTKYKTSEIVAEFSNYGKKGVDIFAPGKDIVSLEPENLYSMNDGTSLASPIVTGVAALVWSHYPQLSAVQLKDVLLRSSYKINKPKVLLPDVESEKRSKGKFHELSTSGGIVNAYQAMLLAEEIANN
ncbi:MAG: S8 family serine peptidase [Cyclobacteriaceae bacterium]